MSPQARRGRMLASADETHLRALSPQTTLRAFTERPMPFDVTRDEYQLFACIDSLTPAERDLGTRVAKAAQRLRSWCDEIAQWGWSGSFDQPTDDHKERRRRSLQMRIRDHLDHLPRPEDLPPLDYWGSLLSVEVLAHEARLDDISDELLQLDVEDLKGHVLDMHPGTRSRPSSAGYGASHTHTYTPMDDFSFLITQTLISALPHHLHLKERLQTWTARVTVLREAPRYLDHLKTAQKAMRLAWDALGPPADPSDAAFDAWKGTVDTLAHVMRGRITDLGTRLDAMLDTLEGLQDRLPDAWIDVFEDVEGDFGRWTQESRRRMIEFDVWRHADPSRLQREDTPLAPSALAAPIDSDAASTFDEGDTIIHHDLAHDSADDAPPAPESPSPADSHIILTNEEGTHTTLDRPRTPQSRRQSTASISSDASYTSTPPGAVSPSPAVRNLTNRAARAPRPALNPIMGKRRKNDAVPSVESTPWPPTQFSHKSPTSADDLERKISDILDTIPAHIRLTRSNGADARNPRSSRTVSNKGSKGYLRAVRSVSGLKSPELTLSPVKQDADSANTLSGRRSTASLRGDNDIRMYHLTQPGKDHPVKLFIRRVGENGERVMVRVGGGWADLGEYLRQYAEHHGRRTASNGQFEILGLEVGATDPSPNRPDSVASRRDRRVSSSTQTASPMTTPNRPPTRAALSTSEAPPPMPNFSPTPTSSNENSETPSTDSSRRSWRGDEVGLAGPKSKKIDLSDDRIEWVEGMMKQARSVSGNMVPQNGTPQIQGNRGESRSESRTSLRGQKSYEFGDLGKVGGTKRLYMRNGVLHEEEGKN